MAGDWVIMPIGAPLCIVREEQRKWVPDELKDEAIVLVRSGSELRDAAIADG